MNYSTNKHRLVIDNVDQGYRDNTEIVETCCPESKSICIQSNFLRDSPIIKSPIFIEPDIDKTSHSISIDVDDDGFDTTPNLNNILNTSTPSGSFLHSSNQNVTLNEDGISSDSDLTPNISKSLDVLTHNPCNTSSINNNEFNLDFYSTHNISRLNVHTPDIYNTGSINSNSPNLSVNVVNESSNLDGVQAINNATDNANYDLSKKLSDYRTNHVGKLIFATLNINSLRNKFDELKMVISGKIDVLVITETKLDDSFPTSQFFIDGYTIPYRIDRNRHGGGVMIYVREDIPSKQLGKHTFKDNIEGLFLELNLYKYKLLLLGTYHPPGQSNDYFFDSISNSLDLYLGNYDRFILLGDFNTQDSESCIMDFNDQYGSKNIVKGPTCFKSVDNPTTIDLILTNNPRSFWNTKSFPNSISDFHALVTTVLNLKYVKSEPKEVTYRKYKNFDLDNFQRDLFVVFSSGCDDYDTFESMFLSTLNLHAPLKKKVIRSNQTPYMTKALRKAMMKRQELQTKYFKSKSVEDLKNFRKQNNYASRLYKKEKKRFYNSLDNKNLLDNKKFWKYIKPFFSDKVRCGNKITLVDKDEIITADNNLADTFNDFFTKAVQNLNLGENTYVINVNQKTMVIFGMQYTNIVTIPVLSKSTRW